jgi:hypothetical protein
MSTIGVIKDLSKFTLRPVESAKVERMSFKLFSSLRSPLRKIKVSYAYWRIGKSSFSDKVTGRLSI